MLGCRRVQTQGSVTQALYGIVCFASNFCSGKAANKNTPYYSCFVPSKLVTLMVTAILKLEVSPYQWDAEESPKALCQCVLREECPGSVW